MMGIYIFIHYIEDKCFRLEGTVSFLLIYLEEDEGIVGARVIPMPQTLCCVCILFHLVFPSIFSKFFMCIETKVDFFALLLLYPLFLNPLVR